MKKIMLFLVFSILLTFQAEAGRGRQPCSGSKGGIAHCTSDGRFVCNDGSLSQSKRFCSGYNSLEVSNQVKPSASTRKMQIKKTTTTKKQVRKPTDYDESVSTQPRQPTCTPLYMANKPGYTHLPICSGKQY